MTDPRWFKLLVRGIGLLLIGISIPSLTTALSYIPMIRDPMMGFSGGYVWMPLIGSGLGGLAQVIMGVYLLFGAPRLVNYCVRQVHTRCPACDYDVRGLQGACPECGIPVSPVESAPRPPQQ